MSGVTLSSTRASLEIFRDFYTYRILASNPIGKKSKTRSQNTS